MNTLKELLGEELFVAVVDALKGKGHDGRDVELAVANDGSYLPKSKFDALLAENRNLKQRLHQEQENADALSALKTEKSALEQALAESEASWQKRFDEMEFHHGLDNALRENHVKNCKAVRALLDMDAIRWQDGTLVGFKEALASVKAEAPYLFEGNGETDPYRPRGGQYVPDYSKMSDSEYYQFLNMKG